MKLIEAIKTHLVLIGHSIGCYIILEMMKRNPELKVLKAVMLFPTIERMAQTPQGRVVTPVICQLRYVAYFPVFLLSLLPESLKHGLVRLAVYIYSRLSPLSNFRTHCANAMYMGGQEMKKVLDRDNATIKKHLHKLIFYYGAADHWCPVEYYNDIKRDFPDGDFRLCESQQSPLISSSSHLFFLSSLLSRVFFLSSFSPLSRLLFLSSLALPLVPSWCYGRHKSP
uniref:Lipid droplet-associated hydrolase n=1 Tax=Periophthalmus magnuspinnatus TaxID=409849 RepID=A0A3B4A433_9GOBI